MTRPWYEVAFESLYPIVYPHRDDAEAARAAALLAPLLDKTGPVLDFACGDGRHVDAFASTGAHMIGADLSEPLLDRAGEREACRGRLACADMRAMPFRDGAFGAVISMFTSFGYFETDAEHESVVAEVARVLRIGGVFILDFLNAALVASQPAVSGTKESAGYTIAESRGFDDGRRHALKHVVVSAEGGDVVADYTERVRLYGREDLEAMTRARGFGVVDVFGDYDGGAFSEWESPRLILVVRKEKS